MIQLSKIHVAGRVNVIVKIFFARESKYFLKVTSILRAGFCKFWLISEQKLWPYAPSVLTCVSFNSDVWISCLLQQMVLGEGSTKNMNIDSDSQCQLFIALHHCTEIHPHLKLFVFVSNQSHCSKYIWKKRWNFSRIFRRNFIWELKVGPSRFRKFLPN